MMTLLSFSQPNTNLNNTVVTTTVDSGFPIVIEFRGQQLVCFTKAQARMIAEDRLQLKNQADLIFNYDNNISILNQTITKQNDLITSQKSEISLLKLNNDDYKKIVFNKDIELSNCNKINKEQKKKINKLKIATVGGFTLAAILPVLVLITMKK